MIPLNFKILDQFLYVMPSIKSLRLFLSLRNNMILWLVEILIIKSIDTINLLLNLFIICFFALI